MHHKSLLLCRPDLNGTGVHGELESLNSFRPGVHLPASKPLNAVDQGVRDGLQLNQ